MLKLIILFSERHDDLIVNYKAPLKNTEQLGSHTPWMQ